MFSIFADRTPENFYEKIVALFKIVFVTFVEQNQKQLMQVLKAHNRPANVTKDGFGGVWQSWVDCIFR